MRRCERCQEAASAGGQASERAGGGQPFYTSAFNPLSPARGHKLLLGLAWCFLTNEAWILTPVSSAIQTPNSHTPSHSHRLSLSPSLTLRCSCLNRPLPSACYLSHNLRLSAAFLDWQWNLLLGVFLFFTHTTKNSSSNNNNNSAMSLLIKIKMASTKEKASALGWKWGQHGSGVTNPSGMLSICLMAPLHFHWPDSWGLSLFWSDSI